MLEPFDKRLALRLRPVTDELLQWLNPVTAGRLLGVELEQSVLLSLEYTKGTNLTRRGQWSGARKR
jgi:hypothetical protein